MVFEKVRETVANVLAVDPEDITMESSFQDDLGADSLDVVELIMDLQDEFNVEIPDEETEKMQTVGDVVEYIKSHTDM